MIPHKTKWLAVIANRDPFLAALTPAMPFPGKLKNIKRHHSTLTTRHSPLDTHHSTLTTRHSPLATFTKDVPHRCTHGNSLYLPD